VAVQFQDDEAYGGGDDEILGRLASAVTDDAGHYSVTHLPAVYMWVNLQNRWQSHGVVRRLVHPLDGKTAQLDFGGTTPLTGRLVAKGQPLANRKIELSTDSEYFGSVMVSGMTDSNGNFTILGTPPGHYTLFYQPDVETRWTALRDVEVGNQPIHLGEISRDVGDVVIHITADDPALLDQLRYVYVNTDIPDRQWQQNIAPTHLEGDYWRAQNVPAGPFQVTAYLNGAQEVNFSFHTQRKPNDPEIPLTLRLSKPTATLKLINTNAETDNPLHRNSSIALRNDDSTVETYVLFDKQSTATLNLPPGTYRVLGYGTSQPRQDIAPIVLKDGQPAEVQADFFKQDANGPQYALISVWSSTGVLVTSLQPKLLDAKGNPAPIGNPSGEIDVFVVHPGSYTAELDRPGLPPVTKEIEISAPSSFKDRLTHIDLILP
jgi:hypothetical protein